MHFGFREPYQCLIDAQLIRDASKYKMNLGNRLQDTLDTKNLKPMITQCCIRHLYNHQITTDAERREKDEWIEVAKAAERRRCGHHELEEPLSALECLESVVDPKGGGRNKNRYVVASQDAEVRRKMRGIAGVPLVYINRSVMILEPMAQATADLKESEERAQVRAGLKGRRGQAAVGMKRKREDDDTDAALQPTAAAGGEAEPVPKLRKARGPKGPNPLSMKKPKKENDKKSAAKKVEDERAVLRRVARTDPQAVEKALNAEIINDRTPSEGVTDGQRKRKRKRKPKDAADESLSVNNALAVLG